MNCNLPKNRTSISIAFALIAFTAVAQTKKPNCKFLRTDLEHLSESYDRYHKCLGVKSGETVASIGAGYARIELHVSLFVDSVNWTLQDVDTTCLSKMQLQKSIKIYEKTSGRKINSDFKTVLGKVDDTNLPDKAFDRIIMVDTYHELASVEAIIQSVRRALKTSGRFVILERVGTKDGEILGCKFLKVLERDLIPNLQKNGFDLESKVIPNAKLELTYYTFKVSR